MECWKKAIRFLATGIVLVVGFLFSLSPALAEATPDKNKKQSTQEVAPTSRDFSDQRGACQRSDP